MIFHHQFIVPNDFIIFFLRNIPLMLGRLRSQFAIEECRERSIFQTLRQVSLFSLLDWAFAET